MGLERRQEGVQELVEEDIPDTRASSTVRNGEGLVEVQVADIATTGRRVRETNLSVQIGTIQIHLTAVVVDDLASILDTGLEDAEGRGVGDHESGKVILVLLRLLLQVFQVEATVVESLDRDDLQAGHDSGL